MRRDDVLECNVWTMPERCCAVCAPLFLISLESRVILVPFELDMCSCVESDKSCIVNVMCVVLLISKS